MESTARYDDRTLFLLIAEGDETGFRKLFEQYVPVISPMIFRVVKTEAAVEDIVQETFMRAWINRDKLPGIEQPLTWLLRIAYYQSFSHLRMKANRHGPIEGRYCWALGATKGILKK